MGDDFLAVLSYGSDTDWLRNVRAAGSAELVSDGQTYQVSAARIIGRAEALPHVPDAHLPFVRLFGTPPEQRKVLTALVLAQIFSGAGLAAAITVGALLAQDMLGTAGLAGLPSALFTIGSAAAAVVVGRLSQRSGRRAGLAMGYAVGAVGALGVLLAAVVDSVRLLFIALFVYGAGTATNLQARYAGADLAPPHRKARAVSTVLVATTLGAVAGPNLVTVTGSVAAAWGIPRLAGPFGLAALAHGAAALVLVLLLRPDPLLLARRLGAAEQVEQVAANVDEPAEPPTPPAVGMPVGIRLGAAVMVVTQAVMVAVMAMTPVHLQHHGHGTAAIGVVIAVHVAAMYLPSPCPGGSWTGTGRAW